LGLLFAIEQLGRWRLRPLEALEGRLQAPFNQTLADILHRLPATTEGVGNLLVRPAGTVGVGLQKNLRPTYPLAGAPELPDDFRELCPFLIRQTNHIQLPHESLLAHSRRLAAA
jgi:hypothetical protein